MINDSLADRAPVEERAEKCLGLWAAVLAQGIRDAAAAQIKRLEMQKELDSGRADGLRQAVSTLRESEQAVKELKLRIESGKVNGKPLSPRALRTLEKTLERKFKSLSVLELRPAHTYLCRDEATRWFWSDSTELGSFLQLYNLFPRLPPVEEFRELLAEQPHRLVNINLEKVSRT